MKKDLRELMIFAAAIIWLCYLGVVTRPSMECDAIGFDVLGRLLHDQGWKAFFSQGLHREPLYPAMIALSMTITDVFRGFSYVKVQIILQIILVVMSMGMIFLLLRRMGVGSMISALSAGYFGISPAITNSALSFFSEVAAYPLVLGIAWFSADIVDRIKCDRHLSAVFRGICLSILLVLVVMVKGVFELVVPVFLLVFYVTVSRGLFFSSRRKGIVLFCILGGCFFLYLGGIHGYKVLNEKYNGNYLVTDRGPWHFYASTVQRTEPLTPARSTAAVLSVLGDSACRAFSTDEDCRYWSFHETDFIGLVRFGELGTVRESGVDAYARLLREGAAHIGNAPGQYLLLTLVESFKMFFWESTQIGFVAYPSWLSHFYEGTAVRWTWRALLAIITMASFFSAVFFRLRSGPLAAAMVWLSVFFILFNSLGSILPRYAFPMVPLYICLAGLWAQYWVRRLNREAS